MAGFLRPHFSTVSEALNPRVAPGGLSLQIVHLKPEKASARLQVTSQVFRHVAFSVEC